MFKGQYCSEQAKRTPYNSWCISWLRKKGLDGPIPGRCGTCDHWGKEAKVPEKQLRCGDCKCCVGRSGYYEDSGYRVGFTCIRPGKSLTKTVNPGWYAGKCFVYKDK